MGMITMADANLALRFAVQSIGPWPTFVSDYRSSKGGFNVYNPVELGFCRKGLAKEKRIRTLEDNSE